MMQGHIHLHNETLAALKPYLVTRGVPMPPGAVKNPASIGAFDAKGRPLPVDARVLQRRPDGSIEWALLDIQVNLEGQETTSIAVQPTGRKPARVVHPVMVKKQGKSLVLDNGLSRVELSSEGGSLIRKLVLSGRTILERGMTADLQVMEPGGKLYRASLAGAYKLTVTHANPLRTEVTVEGRHASRDGSTLLDFALRFELKANNPDLKIEHTFYCREPREGKIAIKAVRLVLPTTLKPDGAKVMRQLHHGHDWFHRDLALKENIELVASSTGNLDTYAASYKDGVTAHATAGGQIFLRNEGSLKENWGAYPFHMRPGQQSGFRAFNDFSHIRTMAPIFGWVSDAYTLTTAFEHFRQLHPKSIVVDEQTLTYNIWPEWATPMQLVQGVSKSHILWLRGDREALDMDGVLDVLGRWEYGYTEPVEITVDPAWFRACEALEAHQFLAYQPDKYPMLENLIEVAPAAGNPARYTYDRQPATGMFHFGCNVNADATSCSNNEDDISVLFPLQHYIRTGHAYAWDYGKEAARHYMEIDFCEWSTDPRQKGGLIPHTGHHYVGNVYPSHQWAEGLLAYYYLSGDERARKAVIAVGDNQVYWAFNKIDCVCCDGREAGMPLVNLAAAYRLTRDERYIEAARHIIKNFYLRWIKAYGEFKYPYPQGTAKHPHKLITGYGDWSSFSGLYRLFEVTGKAEFKNLAVRLLKTAVTPGGFSLNDVRGMDFFAAWILGRLTNDMDGVLKTVQAAVPMLLRRGGHPIRRLHVLKELDERGLIDDRFVGNRAGSI
jgi:hypothetical protein